MLLLQVRAVDENMAANFHQYGLASRSFLQHTKFQKSKFPHNKILGILGLSREIPGSFDFSMTF